MNTDLEVTIVNVIDCTLAGQPNSVNGTFAKALCAQEKIGLYSMLQGYWAAEWQSAYCNTYNGPTEVTPAYKAKCKTNMERWQSQLIIKTTWPQMKALWTLRNEEQHG
jgi:hypothetical protein